MADKSETNRQQVELTVRGMHCASCVANVEKSLRKQPGVLSASVNLATERASVQLDPNGPPTVSDLVEAVRAAGYEAEPLSAAPPAQEMSGARLRRPRRDLLAAIILAIPLFLLHLLHLSPALPNWLAHVLHFWMETRAGWTVQAVLTVAVFIAGAREMFSSALRAALRRTANMDVLVALGAWAAFASSIGGMIANRPDLVIFDAAALIVVFVGIGKYFEARARWQASGALRALAERIPRQALRIVSGRVETVQIDQIRPGDRLRVPAHTLVPVDGEVVSGQAAIDESLLTGESLPVEHCPGKKVFGGTRCLDGLIEMQATATGSGSAAAQIVRLVEQAQMSKPPWQRFADRVASVFVPFIVGLALVTFAGWLWFGTLSWALERGIAVLVVACPCALGLAIPTAVMVGTSRAAQHGILVRDASALEAAGGTKEVLLDKTGTLTLGQPELESIQLVGPADEHQVLEAAAALEQYSEHPLARAVLRAATQRGLARFASEEFQSAPGGGLRGRVRGADVMVGSMAWLQSNGIETAMHAAQAGELAAQGTSLVWVAIGGQVAALLVFADALHPEARAAVEELHRLGVQTRILSGDQQAAVSRIAGELGIASFEAQLTPARKLARVRESSGKGQRVAMVGDGINDAPALAAADVGIAIGTGADVARQVAPICLVGHSPRLIAKAIRISRQSARIMKQNLGWALGYNLVMLPVAIFTALPPQWAAAAMMFSSFSVVANSLRLRRLV